MLEQKDIAVIILLTALSFTVSFFLAGLFIQTPEERAEQVVDVTPFSSEEPRPDARVFNDLAIDPTEDITVGDANTINPFQSDDSSE